ncbi:MAG TPA: flagellar biosynthesis protein FlhA [Verrucomicrobia bacterium]|nr:MAG: flagellar biosynthesis protein FlhA [Lentisphaerae bacterium GWF2_57_35]HBA85814.1 flagellar biosynthesis protein FlhA [Verrucomicrobiota bacterium]
MAEEIKHKLRQTDLIMAGALMMILAVLLIPIPTPLLDILLVLSVGSSILVLVFVIELKDPLEFSSFPSVLLLLTLFRLSLNVATTRQVLLTAYGGEVIQAFGDFVIGGNYVVGVVIFCILMVINFMVITKGSGRIAEVSARFTLDAMPGKQMSIDADLNQGLIDEHEALARRKKLTKEADFYGAMDGASKFVRGDAVAGLIITIINISAGFAIGMLQKDMTAGESLARYTILTVGDGLVASIPSLIISTAAGILVTRAAADEDLGTEVAKQLFVRPKQLMITGSILSLIALVPGLPFIPFVVLGGSLGGLGYSMKRKGLKPASEEAAPGGRHTIAGKGGDDAKKLGDKDKQPEALPSSAAGLKNVLAVSPMDLEIGFGLVPLVDRNQGGKLIDRIGMVRTQIAEELGLVLPPVNVRDNVNLKNTEYCIKIRGLEVARGSVRPGSLMAIDPSGDVKLDGYVAVREPAFGFQAYWIPEAKRELVESKGLTVVDCASVVTTHLAAVVKRCAADIITRQDVNDLIDQIKQTHSAVVQELIPNKMNVGGIHRVLQGLLREKVSIRDLAIILETLSDNAGRTQDIALLVEQCRRALGGHICREYVMADGTLKALGLHPNLESLIRKATHKEGGAAMSPAVAHEMLESVKNALEGARRRGMEPVLLCSPSIRPQVRQLSQHEFRDTPVISFAEVPDSIQVDMISMIPAPKGAEAEALLDG